MVYTLQPIMLSKKLIHKVDQRPAKKKRSDYELWSWEWRWR